MSGKCIDLVGHRFGKLVVIARAANHVANSGKRSAVWLCRCDCGADKTVKAALLRSGKSRSCGCLHKEATILRNKDRSGAKHPNWRGGRKKTPSGYVLVRNPGDVGSSCEYVREHVVVMTRHLGRVLRSYETVHHRNGLRDDNRLENLELWSSRHPRGQRVFDLICWAEDLLSEYAPEKLTKS